MSKKTEPFSNKDLDALASDLGSPKEFYEQRRRAKEHGELRADEIEDIVSSIPPSRSNTAVYTAEQMASTVDSPKAYADQLRAEHKNFILEGMSPKEYRESVAESRANAAKANRGF